MGLLAMLFYNNQGLAAAHQVMTPYPLNEMGVTVQTEPTAVETNRAAAAVLSGVVAGLA